MTKLINFLLPILLLIFSTAYGTYDKSFNQCKNVFFNGMVPDTFDDSVNLCKDTYLAISYDKYMLTPSWVAYYLTPNEEYKDKGGRLSFKEDPDLKDMSINQAPVESKTFSETMNRGHNCPSRAMSWSKDVQKYTYYMSNVAPQDGNFNQH